MGLAACRRSSRTPNPPQERLGRYLKKKKDGLGRHSKVLALSLLLSTKTRAYLKKKRTKTRANVKIELSFPYKKQENFSKVWDLGDFATQVSNSGIVMDARGIPEDGPSMSIQTLRLCYSVCDLMIYIIPDAAFLS